jgi:hypothetical protein
VKIFTHQIADITFRTDSDVPLRHLRMKSFERFRIDDVEPDVACQLRCVDSESLTLPPLGGGDEISIPPSLRCLNIDLESPLLASPVVRALFFDCLNSRENILLDLRQFSMSVFDFSRCEMVGFYSPDQRENFARCQLGPNLIAPFLPVFYAAKIHSSAIVRNGSAALFLAPDEGGKTTVAKNSDVGTVLCDDQVILRKENGVLIAHGSPWGSITTPFQKARVGGFFLLEQAERFELIPLDPVAVMEYMWKEDRGYRLFLPKQLNIKLFEVLADAHKQAPVYRMRFPRDFVDWDAISAVMVK